MRRLAFVLAGLMGCATQSPAPEGPVSQSIASAAREAGVPRDLMVAVAVVEGGLLLPELRVPDPADHVPVAGVLELRHGAFNSLQRGAQLLGVDELALRSDTKLGTRAGALVLAELARETHARNDDLVSWEPALEKLSGMADDVGRARYAYDVLTVLKAGGVFPARGGESVTLDAHAIDVKEPPLALTSAATPEFPGAIWFQTSCTNKCDTTRTAGTSVVDMIVIHDTEGGWDASVATLQNDAGKSVHYIVDADGSRVGQFVPESYTAWHAGNYYYNQRSVGIEHVGFASDPNGYSDGLYAKSTALVKSIRSRWKVPLDRTHIIGHYQIPDGKTIAGGESAPPCTDTLSNCEGSADYGGADNHRDPGFNWQWCQYMQGLGGSCTCNDAWSLWNCTTDKKEAVRCNNGKVEIETCDKGCVVQPVGTNDVCQMSMGGGGSGGSGGGSGADMGGSGGAGGSGGGSGGDDMGGAGGNGGSGGTGGSGGSGGSGVKADNPPHGASGGCSVGGDGAGGAWIILAVAALALARRPRRREGSLF